MDTLILLLLIVGLIGAYFVYSKFLGKKTKPADASESDTESDEEPSEEVEKKEFTTDTLAKHTTKSTKIYVSLKGTGMLV
jgi:flagellar basal body-associated protein FliL